MKTGKNGLTIVLLILLIFICAALLIMTWRLSSISRNMDRRMETLSQGMKENVQSIDSLKYLFSELTADSNEIRGFLMLPEKYYQFDQEEDGAPSETNLEFFEGFDDIMARKKKTETLILFEDLKANNDFRSLISRLSLTINDPNGDECTLRQTDRDFFLIAVDEEGTLSVSTIMGKGITVSGYSRELAEFITRESGVLEDYYREKASLTQEISAIVKGERLSNLFSRYKLSCLFPETNGETITGRAVNSEGRTIVAFGIAYPDNRVSLNAEAVTDMADFEGMFASALETADMRTNEEILIDEAALKITSLSEDAGFMKYLESKHISLSVTPREDNDYYYYDLSGPSGETIGSFAVQKMLGEIYLMDEDDVPISSLKRGAETFVLEQKKN